MSKEGVCITIASARLCVSTPLQMRADRFAGNFDEALDRILAEAGAGRVDSTPPSCISLCALRWVTNSIV
jgi:Flp pilus assembly protein TadB